MKAITRLALPAPPALLPAIGPLLQHARQNAAAVRHDGSDTLLLAFVTLCLMCEARTLCP